MNYKGKKVGIVSLGCDKNRVDSERLLAALDNDFIVTNDINETQILIINTCAFLESARKEAITTVFDYLPYKENGVLEKIVMAGCLPQKFVGELFDALPEVDAFLGTYDGTLIKRALTDLYAGESEACADNCDRAITDLYAGERVNYVGKGEALSRGRYLTTPSHYAYLKIADGCSNHCTYCLIPKIRGPFKSERIEDILEEAKELGEVDEVILVAQDVTKYGLDLYGCPKIVELVQRLSALENIGSIRLLYCYPELVTDELIAEFKSNPKLIKYIDIPFQHASDRILKLMGRKGSCEFYLNLVNKLKSEVDGIAIRSTFIAGFPGETEEDVAILAEFLQRARLFNAGFFAYSKEEDTPAFKLPGHLKQSEKTKRVKYLYKVQNAVMKDILKTFVGKEIEVVCDGVDGKFTNFVGRAYFSAPEIDGNVILKGDDLIEEGHKYTVAVTSVKGCDLVGRIVNELT